MLIREARDEDWAAIFPFWSAIVADGETYAYPEGLSSDAARMLWMTQPHVVVAEHQDRVVGSAYAAPERPGRGAHVATASFMVSPDARGLGVGRALGQHVVGWATSAGFSGMRFNAVVETNTAAVALWRSLGFVIVGTVPGAFDSRRHGLVGLHVMHRTLGPATLN